MRGALRLRSRTSGPPWAATGTSARPGQWNKPLYIDRWWPVSQPWAAAHFGPSVILGPSDTVCVHVVYGNSALLCNSGRGEGCHRRPPQLKIFTISPFTERACPAPAPDKQRMSMTFCRGDNAPCWQAERVTPSRPEAAGPSRGLPPPAVTQEAGKARPCLVRSGCVPAEDGCGEEGGRPADGELAFWETCDRPHSRHGPRGISEPPGHPLRYHSPLLQMGKLRPTEVKVTYPGPCGWVVGLRPELV